MEMLRKHSQDAIVKFYQSVDLLINDSATTDSFKELLFMIISTNETVQDALVNDNPFIWIIRCPYLLHWLENGILTQKQKMI